MNVLTFDGVKNCPMYDYHYEYRVGGSLSVDDPTYIERSADNYLYESLLRGEFCYVLAARQMGKSSLRLQTRHRLETSRYGRCASIDMTRIGSQHLSPDQWYLSLAYNLQRKFGLQAQVNIQHWWQQLGILRPIQKLKCLIEDLLLAQYPQEPLFIFLDEIDSIKGLRFSVSDFFDLIHFFYDKRPENPAYRYLHWTLFGVATARELSGNTEHALFSTGRAIQLSNFSLMEAMPLMTGLTNITQRPKQVFAEVLWWTGGQPFLTQKLCCLLCERYKYDQIPIGMESLTVTKIVRSHIIHSWEAQDEPEHLRTIRDRILADRQRSQHLLNVYQQILANGSIAADGSEGQAELQISGLLIAKDGVLRIANPIYAAIFNLRWVSQHLASQRPSIAVAGG